MANKAPKYSIILAAGKGTRMQSSKTAKVCFPIDGIPAINRAISSYNACGIKHHIIVVGAHAGQVVETVGSVHSNVSFVFQSNQKGTANAVKSALPMLSTLEDDTELLLVPGDRIIDASVLEQMFNLFYSNGSELTLLATPRTENSSQGRLLETPEGDLIAIAEMADIRHKRTIELLGNMDIFSKVTDADELLAFLRSGLARNKNDFPDNSKIKKAFGKLYETVVNEKRLPLYEEVAGWFPPETAKFSANDFRGRVHSFTPEQADKSLWCNNSVYLIRKKALESSIHQLSANNAQQEEYLTDIVQALQSTDGNTRCVPPCTALRVKNPRQILGFNDPAELLEIEAYLQSRNTQRNRQPAPVTSEWYRPIKEWAMLFAELLDGSINNNQIINNELINLYGNDKNVINERIASFLLLVKQAAKKLSEDTPVLLVRSPGRVNVMGRHIDHQGGNCNLMTIGYETLMAVHARNDDSVNLYSLDPDKFNDRSFTISSLLADLPWEDWLSVVNSDKVLNMAKTYGGDWSQYIRAAVLRLQKKFSNIPLKGMDIVVSGNIPMAAGLSSSSTLVVGTAEAAIAVSGLDTFPSQLVDLCGEGEWFVGTRGGSADHAAVKMGQKGKVIKVTFFDFAMEESVNFPDSHVLAVCDSGINAKKTANAKDQFNHRVACYNIGFLLIKKYFPHYAPLLKKLRDVNTRHLGIPLAWIYKILLHLPEQVSREEIRSLLPELNLDTIFSTHEPPNDGLYPIRGVVLFGLAECERSRLYTALLKASRFDEIGRIMNTSHNGDRVAIFDSTKGQIPYRAPSSNSYILGLLESLESGDPEKVTNAQLQWQPGDYHCSCPEIDKMVDIVIRIEGVEGAQLAGAGLGGCMMVFLKKEATQSLIDNLQRDYYTPAKKTSSILFCKPVAGSGVLLKDPS